MLPQSNSNLLKVSTTSISRLVLTTSPGIIFLSLGAWYTSSRMLEASGGKLFRDWMGLLFYLYGLAPFLVLALSFLAIQLSHRKEWKDNFVIRSVAAGTTMIGASLLGYSDFSGHSTGALIFVFWPPAVLLTGAFVFVGLFRDCTKENRRQ